MLTAAALFLGLGQASAMAQAPSQGVKVAYVDLQRMLDEVEDGKRAKFKLKKMFEERQEKLNVLQHELQRFKDIIELSVKQRRWDEETLRRKKAKYEEMHRELLAQYNTMQRELEEAEAKETKKIFDKAQKVLDTIGREHGDVLILGQSDATPYWAPRLLTKADVLAVALTESFKLSHLWMPDTLRITDELIKRYNAGP